MAGMVCGAPVEELPGCTVEDVREAWSRIAPLWSRYVRSGRDVHRDLLHGPALLEACGDVNGLRALDIGCGEGWAGREVASRGASVVGLDISGEMIEEARSHPFQADQQIDYRVMDAADAHRYLADPAFDLVIACMSLHDMADPGAVLHSVRRVLKDDGRLVFSIPHPLTHMAGGRQLHRLGDDALYFRAANYFQSAPYRIDWQQPAGEAWRTLRWSRPLGEYVGLLKDAGFVVYGQIEPHHSRADVEMHQRLRNASEIPSHLVFVAGPVPRRTSSTG
ncbi:MAG: class I SAM-dependent methyltransferase [Chloroflexi bacterium]|nr:MAG: class I SAM-dependent methyltransferase [Chloroflexota bacterium]